MEQQVLTSTIDVMNPITLQKLYDISETGEKEVQVIFERARKAQKRISQLTVKERVKEVMKLNDYIIEHRETILDRIIEETGKSRFDALAAEIFEILDVIDYFKKVAPKILKDQKIKTPIVLMGKKSKVIFEPMGVILVIAPWNYPFYQGLVPAILAFLAGNSVVFKPSEHTPLKGLVEKVVKESGFLSDAIQVVYGSGQTGSRLIHARPQKIHFTGSERTGKKIMAEAAQFLIPVDLELGGKDPSIVFEDVNIERTVNGVMWGGFTTCGQSCTSIERLYVHEKIHDKFVELLAKRTAQLKYSHSERDTSDPEDCDVGSVTTEFQAQIIEKHIQDAVEKGARVLVGGKREEGTLHFQPTVIADATHDMLVMTEETFGPVIPVMKFKTEEEAIRLANDSPYGLGASVWSHDLVRAERVARQIVTGNVSINNHMLTEANPALPFGGTKNSGFGRYKGEWGLTTFSNVKSILIDKDGGVIEPHWYPFTKTKYKMINQIIDYLFSKSRNFLKFAVIGLQLDKVGTKEKLK